MSHDIKANDVITATEKTWHGLENIVERITFDNSGLNWKVASKQLAFNTGNNWQSIDGMQALVRADNNLFISNFSEQYQVIQNSEVFEALQNSLEGIPHKITCAGSLGNCRKVFISLDLTMNSENFINGDKFLNRLLFTNSHDGTSTFRVFDTSVRVVCQNTLTASFADKKRGAINLNVKHTKSAPVKIAEMETIIQEIFAQREQVAEKLSVMAEKPVNEQTARYFIMGQYAVDANKPMATRTLNKVEKTVELFQNGRGNSGQNRYDLLNGVTDFFTHEFGKDANKRFGASLFGGAAEMKSRSYQALADDAIFEKQVSIGRKISEMAN